MSLQQIFPQPVPPPKTLIQTSNIYKHSPCSQLNSICPAESMFSLPESLAYQITIIKVVLETKRIARPAPLSIIDPLTLTGAWRWVHVSNLFPESSARCSRLPRIITIMKPMLLYRFILIQCVIRRGICRD